MKKILFFIIFLQPFLYIVTRFINVESIIKIIDNFSIIIIVICCVTLLIKKFNFIDLLCFAIFTAVLFYNFILRYSQYSVFDFKNLILIFCISITFTNNEIIVEFAKYIRKNLVYLQLNIIISFIIIFLTIISGRGLENSWGVTTLMGPFGLQHALAYYLIIIFCISDFIYKETYSKLFILFKYAAIAMIFFTAVRSATIAVLIIYIFSMLKNKKTEKEFIIMMTLISLIYIFNSNIYSIIPVFGKNINTTFSGDISNGRFAIWNSLIKYFKQSSIENKILGNGAAITYNINGLLYKTYIQAHNDFLNILLCYGIVDLLIYIFLLLKYVKTKSGLILLTAFIILTATNGLYLYYNFVMMIPFLLAYFQGLINNPEKNHALYTSNFLEGESINETKL